MADRDRDINIRVKVKDDGSVVLQTIGDKGKRSLEDIDRQGKKTNETLKAMEGIVATVATAFAGFELLNYGKDAVMFAANVEQANVALGSIANTMGMTKAAAFGYRDALRDINITTNSATNATAQFIKSGLPLDALNKLGTAAQGAAISYQMMTGETISSSEALDKMVRALVTGNVTELHTLGINVMLRDALRENKMATGEASTAVDTHARHMLMLNEVLDNTAPLMNLYADSTELAAKKISSSKRPLEEMKLALGNLFLPELTEAATSFYETVSDGQKWVKKHKDEMDGWRDSIAATSSAITGLVGHFGPDLATIIGGLALARTAQLAFNVAVAANPYIIAGTALITLNEALKSYGMDVSALPGKTVEFADSVQNLIDVFLGYRDADTGRILTDVEQVERQIASLRREIEAGQSVEKPWYLFELFPDHKAQAAGIKEMEDRIKSLQHTLSDKQYAADDAEFWTQQKQQQVEAIEEQKVAKNKAIKEEQEAQQALLKAKEEALASGEEAAKKQEQADEDHLKNQLRLLGEYATERQRTEAETSRIATASWTEYQQAMDDLNQGVMSEHQQKVYAIEQRYAALEEQLVMLVETGRMTFEQADAWQERLKTSQQQDLLDLTASHTKATAEIKTVWDSALDGIDRGFDEWVRSGELSADSLENAFGSAIRGIVADWLRGIATMNAHSPQMSSIGGTAAVYSTMAGSSGGYSGLLAGGAGIANELFNPGSYASALGGLQNNLAFSLSDLGFDNAAFGLDALSPGAFGAGLSGIGSFVTGMLSGQSFQQSAVSGLGAGAGTFLGSLTPLGPIGGILGGALGGMLGGLFGGGGEATFTLSELSGLTDNTWSRTGGFATNPAAGGENNGTRPTRTYLETIASVQEQFDAQVESLRGQMSATAWDAFAGALEEQRYDVSNQGRWGASQGGEVVTKIATEYAASLTSALNSALAEALAAELGAQYLSPDGQQKIKALVASGADLTEYYQTVISLTSTVDQILKSDSMSDYELEVLAINDRFDGLRQTLESLGVSSDRLRDAEQARGIVLGQQLKTLEDVVSQDFLKELHRLATKSGNLLWLQNRLYQLEQDQANYGWYTPGGASKSYEYKNQLTTDYLNTYLQTQAFAYNYFQTDVPAAMGVLTAAVEQLGGSADAAKDKISLLRSLMNESRTLSRWANPMADPNTSYFEPSSSAYAYFEEFSGQAAELASQFQAILTAEMDKYKAPVLDVLNNYGATDASRGAAGFSSWRQEQYNNAWTIYPGMQTNEELDAWMAQVNTAIAYQQEALLQQWRSPLTELLKQHDTSDLTRSLETITTWQEEQIANAEALLDLMSASDYSSWLDDIATAAQYQTDDLIDKWITPVTSQWKSFFDEISLSDLAPVQSREGYQARYQSLLTDATDGGGNDQQAISDLFSFVKTDYLPFMQQYGTDYQQIWDQMFGQGGTLRNLTVDLGEINTQALAAAVSQALAPYFSQVNGESHVVINIDGRELGNFVAEQVRTNPNLIAALN